MGRRAGCLARQHPYYHVGFRVVVPIAAESRPQIRPIPRPRLLSQGREPGPGRGGVRLLPQNVEQQLNLSTDQHEQLVAPEQQVNDRVAQILAPEQRTLLEESRPRSASRQPARRDGFVLRSSEVADGGSLPKEFTGDGSSATLPVEWSGAPAATAGYALIMQGRDQVVLDSVQHPAEMNSLPKNIHGIGTLGNNSISARTEYAPPHSQDLAPSSTSIRSTRCRPLRRSTCRRRVSTARHCCPRWVRVAPEADSVRVAARQWKSISCRRRRPPVRRILTEVRRAISSPPRRRVKFCWWGAPCR